MIKVSELREQIAQNVKKTKNRIVLNNMVVVTDIMQKSSNDEECINMTEVEKCQDSIISTVLRMNDPILLRRLWVFVRTMAD